MPNPLAVFPIWVVAIDYVLGVIMWTLIGRAAMSIFLAEDSKFFFMKFFVKATDPLLRLFRPVTPGFLIQPLVPLFIAWFFFMVRFYLMPRSEEHTSELQSLMRISYAVFCLKKKKTRQLP